MIMTMVIATDMIMDTIIHDEEGNNKNKIIRFSIGVAIFTNSNYI